MRTVPAFSFSASSWIAQGASFAEICSVLGELHSDEASARAVELLLRWLQAEALAAGDAGV